jgi:helix-turn-helix protein
VAREPAHVLEVRRALGRYLAACRRRAHWSQGKLAIETHYHRTAISHLEAADIQHRATSGRRRTGYWQPAARC